jgi:hypothetical protein
LAREILGGAEEALLAAFRPERILGGFHA